MLLLGHKQHLQIYEAPSSMQNEIFSFKEIAVYGLPKRLVRTSSRVCDITNPNVYIKPANMQLPVLARGRDIFRQRALGG